MTDDIEEQAAAVVQEQEYDAQDLQYEIRELLDKAISRKLDPDDVKTVLQYQLNGVSYYYQDAIRYEYVDWDG